MYYQLKHSEGFSSRVWHINVLIMLMLMLCSKPLCGQSSLSPLHVDGPFLVNAEGRRVNLHGFAQTFSPWFNEQGTKWTNYNVNKCLSYNKGIIDGIMNAGWKMTFVRQHMDPYWSNTPGKQTTGENDISAFDFERFKTNLDSVFIPMAEYAIQKGLYVVMRPPGVCPENIEIDDDYHQYLKKVWGYVVSSYHLDLVQIVTHPERCIVKLPLGIALRFNLHHLVGLVEQQSQHGHHEYGSKQHHPQT